MVTLLNVGGALFALVYDTGELCELMEMPVNTKPLFLTTLLVVSCATANEAVFKSVDETGAVTYSSTPPNDAVASKPVAIEPGPSVAEQQAAEQRAESKIQRAEEEVAKREEAQQRAADAQAAAAKEAAAEKALESVEPVETSTGVVYSDERPVLPIVPPGAHDPNTGDHPVYNPGTVRPTPLPAVPATQARPALAR